MELKDLLEYKKELAYYYRRSRSIKAKGVLSDEFQQVHRLLLRNAGEFSYNAWVDIFKKELLEKLGQKWVLREFNIKQEKVDKNDNRVSTTYHSFICLIKEDTKLLKNKYSPEFLEFLFSMKFKQTFSGRITDHVGNASRHTYSFLDLPKKLIGNRTPEEARKTLTEQAKALIKLNNFMVLEVFTSTEPYIDAPTKRSFNLIDYLRLKEKVAIIPSEKAMRKAKGFEKLNTPDNVVENKIYEICENNLNNNEADKNREKIDVRKIWEEKETYQY